MSRLVDGRRRYTHANRAGNVHDPDDLGDWGPLNAVSAPPVYAFRLLNEREKKYKKPRNLFRLYLFNKHSLMFNKLTLLVGKRLSFRCSIDYKTLYPRCRLANERKEKVIYKTDKR